MSADVNVRVSKTTRDNLKWLTANWIRETGAPFTLGSVIDVLVNSELNKKGNNDE